MRRCTRLVSRSSATTCDSVSAVTNAMAVPPTRRAGAVSGSARANGAAAAAARSSRLFMNVIRTRHTTRSRDLSTSHARISGVDLSRSRGRMVLRWHAHRGSSPRARLATSVPGCAAPSADPPLTSRRCSAPTGPGTPRRLPRRPRCGARGGHRTGGVPRRRAQPRPFRPRAAVRPVAAPDRREPGHRRSPRTHPAPRSGARRADGRARERGASGSQHPRGARRAATRATRGGRASLPARLHARGDSAAARASARDRQLAAAPRPGCDADELREAL